MKHTYTQGLHCPGCGRTADVTTNAYGDEGPDVGSVTICAHCFAVSVFRQDDGGPLYMTLQTDDEWLDLPAGHRAEIKRLIEVFRQMKAERENES